MYIFKCLKIYLFILFIVIRVQLSPFSCHHFPLTPPPPTLSPSPLWLCPWVLYTCFLITLFLLFDLGYFQLMVGLE